MTWTLIGSDSAAANQAAILVLAAALLSAAALQVGRGAAHAERPPTGRQGASLSAEIPFSADGLLALSDADTRAQAYINDDIGPAIGDRDTLTLLRPSQPTAP